MGVLYSHYKDVPWDSARWPNFSPDEPQLFCPCCGEFFLDTASFDKLQAVRTALGQPLHLNSGHRCPIHNARVGGAPLSQHKHIAFDISLAGHDKKALLEACRNAGFRGFGFYVTFMHVDNRQNPAHWFINKQCRAAWDGIA